MFKWEIFRIFGIYQIKFFWNCPNWEFSKFSEFENKRNSIICANNKFTELYDMENWEMSKILQFWKWTNFHKFAICKTTKIPKFFKFYNCSSIWYSAPLEIWSILIFFLQYKLISTLCYRLFNRSIFERSLIFKFETSANLIFYSPKFWFTRFRLLRSRLTRRLFLITG